MKLNVRSTYVEGVRVVNGRIYVDDEVNDDAIRCLAQEAGVMTHSLFTSEALKKCFAQTLNSSSDKLDKLVVGEKYIFGNEEENIEITRETVHLYRCG